MLFGVLHNPKEIPHVILVESCLVKLDLENLANNSPIRLVVKDSSPRHPLITSCEDPPL